MSDWPLTTEAAGQFLLPIEGAQAFMVLLRPQAGAWALAVQHGSLPQEAAITAAENFDAEEGGTVVPMPQNGGQGGGWLARYSCAGPGLDLCLLIRFPSIAPEALQPSLEAVEERTGWMLVAALRDLAARDKQAELGHEAVLNMLMEAAEAHSLEHLGQNWISRLEKVFLPGAVMVLETTPLGAKLLALSGGGAVNKNNERREALEALAETLHDRRQGFHITADPASREAVPGYLLERVQPQMEALGIDSCWAVPVVLGETLSMVVLLVWEAGSSGGRQPMGAETCDQLSRALSDSYAVYQKAHPSFARQARNWLMAWVRRIFGKRAWKLKLALALITFVLLVMAVTPSQERPTFSARLEIEDRLVLAAPYDGYLAQAPWRVGEIAPKGALLFGMNSSELELQRVMADAEVTRLKAQARLALAEGNIAQLRALEAEAEQSDMRIDLLERHIAEAQIHADSDLQVLAGDAHLRVGARVRLGEALLEVGDPASMSISAMIDEDWVADLKDGMQGELVLSAFPDRPLPVVLDQITSDVQSIGGINSFRAELAFERPEDLALLDGMRGVVRLDAGRTTVLGNYTRGIRRWMQSFLWKMG